MSWRPPVYLVFTLCAALLGPRALNAQTPGTAYPSADPLIAEAKEAQKRRDKARLAVLREQALKQDHPLAAWVDYWDTGLRLVESSPADIERFYQRWPGSYVEDRLRNDWLLELGRRRDWAAFAADGPRFKMNDDREVHCYTVWSDVERGGKDKPGLAERAQAAWMAQKEADDGCRHMAKALVQAKVLGTEVVWRKLQLAIETNRPRVAQHTADLLGDGVERDVEALLNNPVKLLDRKSPPSPRLAALALAWRAKDQPDDAAERLRKRWAKHLGPEWLSWTWAQVGRQAAFKGQPEALGHYREAWEAEDHHDGPVMWSDEVLAWSARAALRAAHPVSWRLVLRSIQAMGKSEQQDATWVYWKARALQATARPGQEGQPQRQEAQALLQGLASPLTFYGQLATEDLGQALTLPRKPAPLEAAERQAAADHPGLSRALRLLALGLRSEGVREWNFSLRGLSDRELLAAAQRACDREVWDRCINTSDRTKQDIDLDQRFPTPFRREVTAKASDIGLDASYVYGLIRQESRFITDARSHVGASGLMQVMPATAKWTAKRIGMPFSPDMITDREANLRIGTHYLKLVLDDFGGSQALAAAAYNAGPSRPRRWREGGAIEAAAWAETIPFNETRDYVKKVLSNATLYSGVLGTGAPLSLKARLGTVIGPREASTPAPDKELP